MKFFNGLLTGIAGGLAMGILFAPRDGFESRQRIYSSFQKYRRLIDNWRNGRNSSIKAIKEILERDGDEISAEMRKELLALLGKIELQADYEEFDFD